MTSQVITVKENDVQRLALNYIKKIRRDSTSEGIMEACSVLVFHLDPFHDKFANSGVEENFNIALNEWMQTNDIYFNKNLKDLI